MSASISCQVKVYVNICVGNLLCWQFDLCLKGIELEKYRLSNKMNLKCLWPDMKIFAAIYGFICLSYKQHPITAVQF